MAITQPITIQSCFGNNEMIRLNLVSAFSSRFVVYKPKESPDPMLSFRRGTGANLPLCEPGSTHESISGIEAGLSFEVERAFFDCVSVAYHQDCDEAEHAPENNAALPDRVPVHDCPRIHEHNLEVEQDKKHRHHVKLHAEARLAFTLGDHAAFVWGVFGGRTLSTFAYQHTDNQRGSGEENGYEDLQENRQIFA
jgi:hypothetical protein